MSLNLYCNNRIKPKLLREQKTEALLVFIRTTLEQYFKELDTKEINLTIGNEEDTQFVNEKLRKLLEELQECVVNSSYLRSLVATSYKSKTFKMLLKKEEPLMVYYDSIVKGIEQNLQNGIEWIPELMVISLLSEWILEEERSVYLYPFLANINYIELIEKYDLVRKDSDDKKKQIIMNMYTVSSKLIESLKNCKYKVNVARKKRRK